MRSKMSPLLDSEKRYRTFNRYLRERFGCKVYKVSLDAGFTCPNRDGPLGSGGCAYCSGRGSASPLIDPGASIADQMRSGMEFGRGRYKASKFIAYFQAFTNTYAPVPQLRRLYDAALCHPDVVGLSVGTRPDCVPEDVLDLLANYAETHEVWVEYGLQSVHDRTLRDICRGHDSAAFFDAVERTRQRDLRICAHLIFGLPNETREDMLATARAIAPLVLDGVKIHALHVIRGTPLAEVYLAGQHDYLSQAAYIQTVCDALELLPPEVVVQRLTGEAPADVLVGPAWTLQKMETLRGITEELKRRGTWQGYRHKPWHNNCSSSDQQESSSSGMSC